MAWGQQWPLREQGSQPFPEIPLIFLPVCNSTISGLS
jgi:hypothetical protein